MQLIKTAIIKAGNGPAVFVAAAQHSTAAGMAISPAFAHGCPRQVPPCCQTVLPTGLTPPRNSIDCLCQAAVLGRPGVSSICSSSIYVVLTVCQTPCHPSPAHHSTGCCSGLFLFVLTVANKPSSFLSKPSCLPLGFTTLDLPLAALLALYEVLVPPDVILTDTVCSLAGEPIAPGASVTTSLFVPLLVNAAQTSCVNSKVHIQCLPDVPPSWTNNDLLYKQPCPAPTDPFSISGSLKDPTVHQ